MSQVGITYKIAHVDNNRIKTIYAFIGNPSISSGKYKHLDKLFLKNPKEKVFEGIFAPEELEEIIENEIPVKFIPERLHLDDTIEIIKKKILLHLQAELNVSFAELYCFIRQYENFNTISLYQDLTQHEKIDLTKERLMQFLFNLPDLNIDKSIIETIGDKPTYTYEDLLKLNLEQEPLLTTKPLGQKIIYAKTEYHYTVNPYDAEQYDSFLKSFAEEMNTTTNNNILMQLQKNLLTKYLIF